MNSHEIWAAAQLMPGEGIEDAVNRINEIMGAGMSQFTRALKQGEIKCDICGEVMHPMYGGGWDKDRIVCAGRDCGAEIVYPTSTEIDETRKADRT